MEEATVSCLSIDCPERLSLCCGAHSKLKVMGQFAEGLFVCSKCEMIFKGGKCRAMEKVLGCKHENRDKQFKKCIHCLTCGYEECNN